MVQQVVGPITLEGPQAFVDLGKAALDLCVDRWPQLLKADVLMSYVEQIPNQQPWVEGLWRGGARHGFAKQFYRLNGKPKNMKMMYLTLHEILGHPSDQDKMDGKRGQARALMHPKPDDWRDVDGKDGMNAYWHFPFECYANRMVEALTKGVVRSPYDDDYTRYIYDQDLDELLEIPFSTAPLAAAVAGESDEKHTPPDEIVEYPAPQIFDYYKRLERIRKAATL